ncbi:MAG: F0F1 ATP synthase subunit A [Mucispirillum sp.]|nr:F0F1 ATP synthase subunit A [Mucispirillum sp.]
MQHHYLHVFMLGVAVCIILVLGLIARSMQNEVPSKLQNVFEGLVGGVSSLADDVMGKEGRAYLPVILGIGLYVGVSNLMSLVPGLIPPTSNMNTTAAPALLVFVLYNCIGIKKHGASYIKHFMGPMAVLAPFMLIIELISHLARPLSLTMRLFGNIAGEDLVVVILFMLVPFLLPIPMFFLMVFTSILQAFVFMVLAMVYIAGALEEAH